MVRAGETELVFAVGTLDGREVGEAGVAAAGGGLDQLNPGGRFDDCRDESVLERASGRDGLRLCSPSLLAGNELTLGFEFVAPLL